MLVLYVIALYDSRHHRIPNFSLLILLIVIQVEGAVGLEITYLAATLVGVFFFHLFTRCGFGDVKLALILLNTLIPHQKIASYLLLVCLCTTILIMIHFLRTRNFNGSIAFAPALCGGVLLLPPISFA